MVRRKSCSYGAALAAVVLGAMSAARAADSGPFIGFDLGWAQYPSGTYHTGVRSEEDPSSITTLSNSHIDGADRFGWGIDAGYRFNRYLDLEVGYVDLGRIAGLLTDPTGASNASARMRFSASGETLAVTGRLPFGRGWDAYLKGGFLLADAELRLAGTDDAGRPFASTTEHRTVHWLSGVGIERRFDDHWSVHLGLTGYQRVGDARNIRGPNIRLLGLGLSYGF
jgi:OmpA-OmpF porin, OOP family